MGDKPNLEKAEVIDVVMRSEDDTLIIEKQDSGGVFERRCITCDSDGVFSEEVFGRVSGCFRKA